MNEEPTPNGEVERGWYRPPVLRPSRFEPAAPRPKRWYRLRDISAIEESLFTNIMERREEPHCRFWLSGLDTPHGILVRESEEVLRHLIWEDEMRRLR